MTDLQKQELKHKQELLEKKKLKIQKTDSKETLLPSNIIIVETRLWQQTASQTMLWPCISHQLISHAWAPL